MMNGEDEFRHRAVAPHLAPPSEQATAGDHQVPSYHNLKS